LTGAIAVERVGVVVAAVASFEIGKRAAIVPDIFPWSKRLVKW